MIAKAITETVDDKEVDVGISFIAENENEVVAFRTWMGYKNIGNIVEDGKEINIRFTDIDDFLSRTEEGDLDASSKTQENN